jgi:methionyl-tRNA formyltransferase
MKPIVAITQGSQGIQLIRKLFELGYKPEQILVFTEGEVKNQCFIEFIIYYKIEFLFKINYQLIKDNALIISYSNSHKINTNQNFTFINFHPGLLPKYRGSLSTVHSMVNNEKVVGGT